MVYEITERTTDANGQEMLFSETEIDMYWTSLGVSDEEVIALYHNHAVCEQYHSEIKTDMGIERLPSGKFETNALILKLTMIAYNILRIIGSAAMKGHDMPVRHSTIKRRRLRTVIDNLILIAGHRRIMPVNYDLRSGVLTAGFVLSSELQNRFEFCRIRFYLMTIIILLKVLIQDHNIIY